MRTSPTRFSLTIRPAIFDTALLLPILFIAVTLPQLALRRNVTGDIAGEVSFVYAASVYVLMAATGLFFFRFRAAARQFLSAKDLPLALFMFHILLQSLVLQSTFVMLQAGIFICAVFVIRSACISSRFRRGLAYSSYALVAFILLAYLLLGPPEHRWLGGIHPNVFGASCVAAFALSLFGPRWWRDFVLVVVLALALAISSRYTMVTCVLIYLSYSAMNWRAIGRLRLTVIAALALLAAFSLAIDPENSPIGLALKLGDSSRGLGSGASGRDQQWVLFLPQLFESPFFGYGFRNRGTYFGAHNGFLDVFLQTGLIGGALFFTYYFLRLGTLFQEALALPPGVERGKLFSILLGISVGAQLQPQLFSFGDPFGITAMICLFSIVPLERTGELIHVSRYRGQIGPQRRLTGSRHAKAAE
ncbi:O-antigen ligase family protein [Paenirhodobacter sp. CAU 1674]|uniref:O-antigen ligase family protein n=1 Tax=Paenirhodobacter sp. CAU 1674 TaxID=3032596 RepID=UPI0023DC78F4|nr:O-antigen ligase family protein [Paenirhodobacter sp. CAU 1674]MDF2142041.1 hypothetical protein [Paenirhodobacter sp. CAU 1674]